MSTFNVGQQVVCIASGSWDYEKDHRSWWRKLLRMPQGKPPGPKKGEVVRIIYIKENGYLQFLQYMNEGAYAPHHFRHLTPLEEQLESIEADHDLVEEPEEIEA